MILDEHWGGTMIASMDQWHDAAEAYALVAEIDEKPAGLLTFRAESYALEILTLNTLFEGRGVGTQLLQAIENLASQWGRKRVWLVLSNDNLDGLRFYQKRGYVLTGINVEARIRARAERPGGRETGQQDIPIRDELLFAKFLEMS